nr:hypothetical protein [Novosphingobium sp.]
MTRSAAGLDFGFQEIMCENALGGLHQPRACMIGMTRHAISLGKRLMECDFAAVGWNCLSLGRSNADLRNLVAIGTAIW